MGGQAGTDMKIPNGAEGSDIGDLRFHADDKGLDEVHVHDDKAGLKFLFKGRRAFSLGMERLLAAIPKEEEGIPFIVHGEAGHKSAADLLFERKKDGWKLRLVPKGSRTTRFPIRVACDKNLALLDDFIHRI